MSSNDKAKQKLMESMRMTKSSPGKKNEDTTDKKQDMEARKTKLVKPKKKISTSKKTPTDTQKIAVDPFQSARRVWPD